MDINQNLYIAKSPFVMGFALEETRQTFLKGYTPQSGFSISDARRKEFFIFCSGHRFGAEFFLRSGEKAGFRIKGRPQVMSQNDTVKVLSEDKKIFGLDPKYMVDQQDWDVINTVSPRNFKGVLEFLGVDAPQTEESEENDPAENNFKRLAMEQRRLAALFYDVQERIIDHEREFFKKNLFVIPYSKILTVTQSKEEKSVFAFEIGLVSDSLAAKLASDKPLKITLKNEKSASVNILRYSAAEGLLYCITSAPLDDIPQNGILQERENVGYRYITDAVNSLRTKTSLNPFLEALILNGDVSEVKPDVSYKNPMLNQSQEQAVQKALQAEDFLLIQGPPGTGKTQIIVEMVKEFIKQNKRILICSQSNHAVDNVLKKCLDLHFDAKDNPPVHCLRIGTQKIEPELLQNTLRPLTETIQNDMLQRSVDGFAAYKQKKALQIAAIKEFEYNAQNMAYLISCLLWLNNILRPVGKAVTNSASELFFTPKRLTLIRRCLGNTEKFIFNSVNRLADLLNSPKPPSFDPFLYFNEQLEGIGVNIDICIKALSESNLFNFFFVKGNPQNDLIAAKNYLASQKDYFCNCLLNLRKYSGNMASDILPKVQLGRTMADWHFNCEDYYRSVKNAADSLKVMQNDLELDLKSWHSVLRRDNDSLSAALLKSIKIVGATCISSQAREFSDLSYDVAIVDEAGQIPMHNLIVPLAKVKKVILVGDHIQLPPVENSDLNEHLRSKLIPELKAAYPERSEEELLFPFDTIRRLYSVSLFEILYNRNREEKFGSHCVMLNTQYRCHPKIAEFVSEHFYEGAYQSGIACQDRTIDIAGFDSPIYFIDTANLEKEERFEKYSNSSVINTAEALLCARECVNIVTAIHEDTEKYAYLFDKHGNFEVGVISGYSAQVRLLHQEIRRLLIDYFKEKTDETQAAKEADSIMERIAIDSLDSFQGMEKEIIIFSATRSNEPDMIGMNGEPLKRHTVGFLDDTRRLNVLMTRAKRLLVMVGDSSTLKQSAQRAKHNRKSVGKLFSSLLENSVIIDAAKGRDIDEQ